MAFLRYTTFFYRNWHRNGKPSKLKVQKQCLNYDDLCSEMHLLGTLFLDFEHWWLAILKSVKIGKSYIPQKKPYYWPFESRFKTGRILVMGCSRWILVKVMLFQWRGCGHPQDDSTPNFSSDFKCSIIGISNDISLFQFFYGRSGISPVYGHA